MNKGLIAHTHSLSSVLNWNHSPLSITRLNRLLYDFNWLLHMPYFSSLTACHPLYTTSVKFTLFCAHLSTSVIEHSNSFSLQPSVSNLVTSSSLPQLQIHIFSLLSSPNSFYMSKPFEHTSSDSFNDSSYYLTFLLFSCPCCLLQLKTRHFLSLSKF